MKKKCIIFSIVTLVLLVSLVTSFNYFKTTNNYVEDKVNNQTKITKGISMNIEQTAGAGDYKTVTQSSWPTEGYKFNTELSRCENGSELSWDDTKKAVIVSGNLSDKCYVYFDLARFDETCDTSTLACHIAKQYTGTQGDNGIYYHNSTLANGAGDNSYRYAGGDYVLTDAGKAIGATKVIGYSLTTDLIHFVCDGFANNVGEICDPSQTYFYLIKGDDTTQYQTYNEVLNKAVEKGYLTKDNVKNFVCFGSDATTCPTENLYRIIGVFNNQVKLIKWDYAKSSLLGTDGDYSDEYTYVYFSGEQGEIPSSNSVYSWNNAGTNTWSESNLNKTNLNTNFIKNIGTTWAEKIATTTWKVGGGSSANIREAVPATAYQYEVGSSASSTTYEAKIGLMYLTDYYYAASPSAWTLFGFNSDNNKNDYASAKGDNWLYGGGFDWTISRHSDDYNHVFYVVSDGSVDYFYFNDNSGVRPVFNLLPSITYVSGSGTMSDPIRIN